MQGLPYGGNAGIELAAGRLELMHLPARTFPFIYVHLRHTHAAVGAERRSRGRGFTLIELMVVVVVIAITAAIAMPGIMNRMKSNRAKMAAEQIAVMYRQARLRAMGRSAAVLVRFNGGVIEVREAIQGTPAVAGCNSLPEVSCTFPANRWTDGNNRYQQLETRAFNNTSDFTVVASDGAPQGNIDVCFAPSGRAFIRTNPLNALAAWTSPIQIDVTRTDGVGFLRSVLVSPTGVARVVAQGVTP